MTDKELHRLSRRELLQLLLTQAKNTEELGRLAEEREEQLDNLRENYERLKKRLDQKDAQIHDLRTALHEERSNRRIELEEAGSIAEAALRLNGIFDMAQKAAEQYLYNIRLLYEKEEARAEKCCGEAVPGAQESMGPERAEEPRMICPEEPESPMEGMAGQEDPGENVPGDLIEEMPEPGPENLPGEMPEPGPEGFSEDLPEDMEEYEYLRPEDDTPEPDMAEEDMPGSGKEKSKGRIFGRKKQAKHKK